MMPIIQIAEIAVKLMPLAIEVIKALGKALEAFAKALGGINPEESMDQLGDKALQAEENGIKPENYESYEEYVKAVENFEVDPEKSKVIDEKLKYIKGIELTSAAIQEKYPGMMVTSLVELAASNPVLFTASACATLGKIAKENPEAVNTLCKYLQGEAKGGEAFGAGLEIAAALLKAENPKLSDMEAAEKALNIGKEEK